MNARRAQPIRPSTKFFFYADGGSKNNGAPNQEGYGSYYVENKTGDSRLKRFEFGCVTNNQAEWYILHKVLEALIETNVVDTHAVIYMDSLLVINQYNGLWKVKSHDMKPLYALAIAKRNYLATMNVHIQLLKIPREEIEAKVGH